MASGSGVLTVRSLVLHGSECTALQGQNHWQTNGRFWGKSFAVRLTYHCFLRPKTLWQRTSRRRAFARTARVFEHTNVVTEEYKGRDFGL